MLIAFKFSYDAIHLGNLNAYCIQVLDRGLENIPQCGWRSGRIVGPLGGFFRRLARDARNNSEDLVCGSRPLISAMRMSS
jgi:hypothetical protein